MKTMMTEDRYIHYLAHMLDESCNEKDVPTVDEADFQLKLVGSRNGPRRSSGNSTAGSQSSQSKLDKIRAMTREDAVKNGIDQNMWFAAQLPDPEEDKHGQLGACEIVQGSTNAPLQMYRNNDGELKTYYVKGYYADGETFTVGPTSNRKIAIFYIQLHSLSVNEKEWQKFKSQLDAFDKRLADQVMANAQQANDNRQEANFKLAKFDDGFAVVDTIKLVDGVYLRMLNSNKKLGPFPSQNVAHRYAGVHKYDTPGTAFEVHKQPDGKFHVFALKYNKVKDVVMSRDTGFAYSTKEQAAKEAIDRGYAETLRIDSTKQDLGHRIDYPIFVFEYEMAGIDCMDIVIAETKQSAIKMFALQWRSFDGSKVIKNVIRDENELERELMPLRIKNVNIFEIDNDQLQEYVDMAKEIGNPMTNPQLKSRQRNRNCQYQLGPDMKSGRLSVTLRQDFERRKRDNLSQKRVKPGSKY